METCNAMTRYNPDEVVVYPGQGIGTIESIVTQELEGNPVEFYNVRIHNNRLKLLIPVKNAATIGLRYPVSPGRGQAILDYLHSAETKPVHAVQNWNRRFRDYTMRIKNSDLEIVAGVFKELLTIAKSKILSFGERRLLEQVSWIVLGELSEVLGISEKILHQSFKIENLTDSQ